MWRGQQKVEVLLVGRGICFGWNFSIRIGVNCWIQNQIWCQDGVWCRVNPIRIESCESFRMRAEAFISECLVITNDSNGSGIIKCE